MNPQGGRWAAETVLALAPDAASRKAGSKLAAPGPWSGAGSRPEEGGGAVWGECSGSGSTPYRTVVDLSGEGGPGFNCSCPSRKFPCKHALGLLLLWASCEAAVPVARDAPPGWAEQWLDRRRQRAERAAAGPGAAAPTAPAAPADEEAARRRGERRAARIAAGVTELEQRLTDLLRGGLAAAEGAGYGQWDETAARMVDAQAPGLASRVRELASLRGAGADRAGRLLEECALLHTLNQGWLRLGELPGPLAATVRSRVGLTTDAAALLASGPLVRDHWLVLAQRDSDDGRLTTRRIWLHGRGSGRMAVLLSYGAAGRAPELSLPVGLSIDADLVYYPAARPLRAALGTRHAPPVESPGPPPGGGVEAALSAYGEALRDDPWLETWPVVLEGVIPVPPPPPSEAGSWQLADAEGESALEVDPRHRDGHALWQLTAISAGTPITVFAEYGHDGVRPLSTWAPEPVPL
ncbi:SWIM zinc finger family protein [Streptomyces klenkii]|uniref:SWIM zinc finger family protein n=1 Tax=Streptomyces klenkii TaxID=1420899 RepID=UPI0033C0C763